MKQVVIENPVINSPYVELFRHFKFSEDGITDEIVEARRVSSYFIPTAKPKKGKSAQLTFETEWTQDRVEENKFISQIRSLITLWRQDGNQGVRHPPQSGWLDEWGRLKGGRSFNPNVALKRASVACFSELALRSIRFILSADVLADLV